MISHGSRRGLHLFRPPYVTSEPVDPLWHPDPVTPGCALVWFLQPEAKIWEQLDWLGSVRPRSVPLFVVLPEPEEIVTIAPILRSIPTLRPRGVLPTTDHGTLAALRLLLAAPPTSLAEAVANYLQDVGMIRESSIRERITTIFAAAPHISSIERLSSMLAQSRRTLGRHFSARELPVPSHWLQFARLLHVAVQLQNTTASIHRVAGRFGYSDGFTLSNAMKRLTGYRPSFVRRHLGWEWLVAAWLREES